MGELDPEIHFHSTYRGAFIRDNRGYSARDKWLAYIRDETLAYPLRVFSGETLKEVKQEVKSFYEREEVNYTKGEKYILARDKWLQNK